MLNVRLPENIEHQLAMLVKETGRSKSYYVKEALENYLEDRYDTLMALEALVKSDERISLHTLKARLGLED